MSIFSKLAAAIDNSLTSPAATPSGDVDASPDQQPPLAGMLEKMREWKSQAAQKVDQTAQRVAEKCTELTGREMSAADVKRSAAIGAAIGTTFAAGPLVLAAMRQVQAAQRMAGGQAGNHSAGDGIAMPSVAPTDPTAAREADDIAYDQQLYDNLQDDIAYHSHLDSVIDDQMF